MTKENILYGIIGLLLGLIVGFGIANSINRNAISSVSPAAIQTGSLPEGHPETTGNNPTQEQMANAPAVKAAIEQAKNEPDNFDAQLKAAEFQYQIQRFDTAIELLLKANKIKPDDYPVIVHLGNAYFDSKKYEEAEKWYSSALAKKPDDVNVRTDLGLTFMFRSIPDYDRAIKEFTGSLETDPNHLQTLQNLTVAYTKKGIAEKAKATLLKLESLDPNNSALAELKADVGKLGN